MAILILAALAIGWWITWWGSSLFEVRGWARRLEDAIDRRYKLRDEDGLAMLAAKGIWAGMATFLVTWGGFLVPLFALALIGYLVN